MKDSNPGEAGTIINDGIRVKKGDVTFGTHIEQLIINLYRDSSPLQLDDKKLRELRDAYLGYLQQQCKTLDFRGIPLPEAVEKTAGLSLRDVYVPVRAQLELPKGETWQRIAGRYWKGDAVSGQIVPTRVQPAETISIEDMINNYTALVILGDPGAGKSTLLKYLALNLATVKAGVLPILVPLNAYSKALQENTSLNLSDFLPSYFAGRQHQLKGLGALFQAALNQDKAVVLLDGLDEVVAERGRVVALVDDFVREYLPEPKQSEINIKVADKPILSREYLPEPKQSKSNRIIATSRFVGYREAPLRDTRWRTAALVDWEKEEIERFVERFTLAVETLVAGGENEDVHRQAERERQSLLNSIFGHEGIERLAGNPLLLTILVLIKRQGVELPNRRVELYELYLDTLLRSWNKARALDKIPVGPDIDYHAVWQILAPMALWLRRGNPQAGLVSERQLYDFLLTYYREEEECLLHEARKKTGEFLDSVHRYSSLLLERGREQYGFIHQTLEEYLAGCGLTLLPREEALQEILAHLDEPHWRETLLLGFGALGIVRKAPRDAGELLERLLQAPLPDVTTGANMLLAGEVLRDVGQVGVGAKTARIITTALVKTMQDASIQTGGRREAGLILGDLGWLPKDLDEFVVVEPDSFLYGSDKELRTISQHYWIAKYPVTNSQYARFVETGYAKPRYWSDKKFNNPLLPVVGVSWNDTHAYCQWLHEQFNKEGFQVAGTNKRMSLPDGYIVLLPTEDEWERAARGTDGREYPWGNEFKDGFSNTNESGLKGTTAVCTYPAGISPVGAWDMAGNVWEWTASKEGKYRMLCVGSWFNYRMLCGGSWRSGSRAARGAFPHGSNPDLWNDDRGLRVVVSQAIADF